MCATGKVGAYFVIDLILFVIQGITEVLLLWSFGRAFVANFLAEQKYQRRDSIANIMGRLVAVATVIFIPYQALWLYSVNYWDPTTVWFTVASAFSVAYFAMYILVVIIGAMFIIRLGFFSGSRHFALRAILWAVTTILVLVLAPLSILLQRTIWILPAHPPDLPRGGLIFFSVVEPVCITIALLAMFMTIRHSLEPKNAYSETKAPASRAIYSHLTDSSVSESYNQWYQQRPQSTQPSSSRPESYQPYSSRPESSQFDYSRPQSSQFESLRPQSSQLQYSQPERSKYSEP
jgi:hypothetical protein